MQDRRVRAVVPGPDLRRSGVDRLNHRLKLQRTRQPAAAGLTDDGGAVVPDQAPGRRIGEDGVAEHPVGREGDPEPILTEPGPPHPAADEHLERLGDVRHGGGHVSGCRLAELPEAPHLFGVLDAIEGDQPDVLPAHLPTRILERGAKHRRVRPEVALPDLEPPLLRVATRKQDLLPEHVRVAGIRDEDRGLALARTLLDVGEHRVEERHGLCRRAEHAIHLAVAGGQLRPILMEVRGEAHALAIRGGDDVPLGDRALVRIRPEVPDQEAVGRIVGLVLGEDVGRVGGIVQRRRNESEGTHRKMRLAHLGRARLSHPTHTARHA